MLEEFTALASTSGFAAARHWYWRQSVKTIAHLIGSEFRVAPLLLMLRGPVIDHLNLHFFDRPHRSLPQWI
jgi:hypothetical protein